MSDEPACAGNGCASMGTCSGRSLMRCEARAGRLRGHGKRSKAAYRRRKWIAEPSNGWVKNVLGFRLFSLRDLHRVQAECKLVCLALNPRRMCDMKVA
jgi:hypothetical protein